MNDEVKWRGSTYKLVSVDGDLVTWHNPVSRHTDTCDVASWKAGNPYGSKY